MSRFHADDYVDFLKRVTPDGMTESNHKLAYKCKLSVYHIYFLNAYTIYLIKFIVYTCKSTLSQSHNLLS